MKFFKKYLILWFILFSGFSFGQYSIKGTVVDKNTKQPLPFVNIVYNNGKKLGTTTDLDGRFQIQSNQEVTNLEVSFMGYKNQKINTNDLHSYKDLEIELEPQSYTLPEAKVYAKENPAHRIINNAIKNRKRNNPKSLSSFKYDTYSKMFFTFDVLFYKNGDTLTSDQYQYNDTLTSLDSNIKDINKLRNDQYLFLMESVTEKKYKKPGKVHEEVLASRVSGFKNPVFTLLASQLQSFTIYSDYISVSGKKYLSPLAKNSTSKYIFIIEDTLLNNAGDTTYALSYRPRKNKNFNGLQGIININTKGWAVENFSTKPTQQETYTVTIRQKYELIQDSAWFPTQLDADFTFANILNIGISDSTHKGPDNATLYGKAKTYINHIDLNPKIKNKEFSYIALNYEETANNKDSLFWSKYRVDTISKKEMNTYRVIDSLGKATGFERKFEWLSYLMKGEVPFGPISLDINKLMNYNVAEGFRLGLGLKTNDKICKNVNIGGYGAYGFSDEKWKYGGTLKINIRDYYDSHIDIKYQNDISEIGGFNYLESHPFLNPETYRDFLIRNVVYEESGEIAVEARFMYYLKTRVFAKFSNINFENEYYELDSKNGVVNQFQIPEIGLKIRYAYQEHYVKTPIGIQALKTKYPVLFFNMTKAVPFGNYKLDYTRIWAKVEKNFTIRNVGISSISLQSGYAYGDIPYHNLFNGHGSYYPFTIVALNSFGTMRLNEFISDRFVYLFYRHNFGKLLLKTDFMEPEFSIVQNIGWGNLVNREQQLGVSPKTMDKGFVESGLIIDNLFKLNYIQYGIGIYYRYGAYSFTNTIDNFGFKLSFKYTLSTQ